MRAFLWLVVLAIGGAAAYAYHTGYIKLSFFANAGVCLHNDEIDPEIRSLAQNAAKKFLDAVVAGDATAAHVRLTDVLRKQLPIEKFAETMKQFTTMSAGVSGPKLEHSYKPRIFGTGGETICATSGPDGHVVVKALPLKEQMHLVYTANSTNNEWTWTLWLVENDGPWEVRSFNFYISSLAGLRARDLLHRAKEQDAKGHSFNAHMLYVGAAFTANRGPDFTLGVKQEADEALERHTAPPEFAGTAPFRLIYSGRTFSVTQVRILGVDEKLALLLVHRDEAWTGASDDAALRNKMLIDGFVKAHPEYSETFGIIVARITGPNRANTWGTVFDAKTGYVEDKGDKKAGSP